jgi:hypothetical protein
VPGTFALPDFIKANAGNIIVGFIVFGVLAFTVARLVINFRRGKSSCGCGCGNCPKRDSE